MIDNRIHSLVRYGLEHNLIAWEDRIWALNQLAGILGLDGVAPSGDDGESGSLNEILEDILKWAYETGRIPSLYAETADLLDTALMGVLTPRPSEIVRQFSQNAVLGIDKATDWFYRLCCDNNYIRMNRVSKNLTWKVETAFGLLDITINRSKPEKDPRAIAEAANSAASGYPACLLCLENVGYSGRQDHPARQNLRTIPITLGGEPWHFQYSPYVYYNEHAIIFSESHVPMGINRKTFERLLDFVDAYPHYFIGSNADLPIVGGSMLAHDHYQGGRYRFPMEDAAVLKPIVLRRCPDVMGGFLNWPLSTIRLTSENRSALLEAAESLRASWSAYSDLEAGVKAFTGDVPHNTVTPIARKHGSVYELDIVLRNNRRSEHYPDGVFHPHPEIHAVKKENIGLIEVMGLAVLPDRLVEEMDILAQVLSGKNTAQGDTIKLKFRYLMDIIDQEPGIKALPIQEQLKKALGLVFLKGLSHCGVMGQGDTALRRIDRFIDHFEGEVL